MMRLSGQFVFTLSLECQHLAHSTKLSKICVWKYPGVPVVNTRTSGAGRGHRFNPWPGANVPHCSVQQKKKLLLFLILCEEQKPKTHGALDLN